MGRVTISSNNLFPGPKGKDGADSTVPGPTGPTGATGATGATGSSGVIAVTAPITNSGTSTSATIGIDQTSLAITETQVSGLTAKYAQLAAANTFTTSQIIAPSSTSAIGLTITQPVSSSVIALNVTAGSGASGNVAQFASTGISTGGRLSVRTGDLTASFNVNAVSATNIAAMITGAASQTADLQRWQDSGGNPLIFVGSGGQLRAGGSIAGTGWAINNQIYGASVIGMVIRGAASQTANLQEWQDSAATKQAWITSAGSIQLLSGGTTRPIGWNTGAGARATINTSANADLTFAVGANSTLLTLQAVGGVASTALIQTATATSTVLIAKGAASQTGNLQEWQNSSATVLTSVNASGTINFQTGNTSATANTGAVALPALAVGFITMQVAGTTVKVPYYAN